MQAICLLESISRADGGIFEAECALQRHLLLHQKIDVEVVGLEDQFTSCDISRWLPLKPVALPVTGPASIGYSMDLLPALDLKADLLYSATLWKYPSWAALKWAVKTGKPMMVAPHGSLDPWALRSSRWKKQIAATLFKDRQLHKATCLRALSKSEAESFRAYGLRSPIAIIPNGIDLPEENHSRIEERSSSAPKILLFLGRIHPKKGLPNALRAFKKSLDRSPLTLDSAWQFVIAGWDQGGHEAELMKLCNELGMSFSHKMNKKLGGSEHEAIDPRPSTLDSKVIFWGAAFGKEKDNLLKSADAFILPSLSEGLPMSVLEAWAYGIPVVMTPECNLPEGFQAEAALRINHGLENIIEGLHVLFSMSHTDLASMGERGRALVQERFTWRKIAFQMRECYSWMLGGGTPPEAFLPHLG
jgi:poly(glycerol-phosphate) alpha-glucosyltransferase